MGLTRAEIQALIDAAPDGRIGQPPGVLHQAGRPVVWVPYGEHHLDGSIVVDRRLDVRFSGSTLVVPDGVRAIHAAPGAWCGRARDFTVFGGSRNAAQHGTDGVFVEAFGFQVSDALARYVGTGLRAQASVQQGANANGLDVRGFSAWDCDTGLHLKGGDTNGGSFAAIKINGCRVGLLDESFLGNHFSSVMFHTIAEHAYRCTVPANYSYIAGVYVELDCGSALPGGWLDCIEDQPLQTWVGGNVIPLLKRAERVGYGSTRLRFGETAPDGSRIRVRIPDVLVESAMTAERRRPDGTLRDGLGIGWSQLLQKVGVWLYGAGGAGTRQIQPLSATGVDHPAGHGHARVNGRPSTEGPPQGYDVPKPSQ